MSKAIVIEKTGGPEVLKIINQGALPQVGPNDLFIKNKAIGVNFIDINQRKGLLPLASLPATLGFEGVGEVLEAGESVAHAFEAGDRVAYATAPMGSYAGRRVIDHRFCVKVPTGISDEVAASCFLKGLTAHYLLRRTFFIVRGSVIVVHAAAGGVGSIMVQWAKHIGATVIGTVGSEGKKLIAKKLGCDYVFNYKTEDYPKAVMEITKGLGANVVYDGVGKDTFDKSLDCLCPIGVMVCYGESSGIVPPIDLRVLARKSLYLARPTLFDYKRSRMELVMSGNEIFQMVLNNIIKINYTKYKFDEVAKAHSDIEARKTTGSVILTL